MKKNEQNITGNNNLQVGVNHGQIINTQKVKIQTPEVKHNPELQITDAQASQIQKKIREIAEMVASNGKSKASAFSGEYIAFKDKFNITSYTLLPKERFEEAMTWLKKKVPYRGKKALRHGDKDQWRKEQYKAINARSKNLGMDRAQMLAFAETKLELSDTRLQKLYTFIMRQKLK